MVSKKRTRAAASNSAKKVKISQEEHVVGQSEPDAASQPTDSLLEFVSIKEEPIDIASSPISDDRQSPIDPSPKKQSKKTGPAGRAVCELCLRKCPPASVVQFSLEREPKLADGLEKVQQTLGIQLEPRPFSVCRTCWQLVEIVATFRDGCLKAREWRLSEGEASRDEAGSDEWFAGKTVKAMEHALQISQSNLDWFSKELKEVRKAKDGPDESSFDAEDLAVKDEGDADGEDLDESVEPETQLDMYSSVTEKLEISFEDHPKDSAIKARKAKLELPSDLTPLPVYECTRCGRRFDSKTGLGIHVRRTEESEICKNSVPLESPHCCTVCRLYFKTKVLLKCHLDKHLGTKSLACRKGCGKMFYTGAALRVHEHDCGSERKKRLCPHCGLSFFTNTHLNRHMSHVHGEATFPCKICRKQFTTREAAARHVNFTHSTENTLCCKLCNKMYKNPDSLRVHMRLHTNEMPYGCTICGQRFRYGHAVRPHMLREHHGTGDLEVEAEAETGGGAMEEGEGGE
uniref:Putative c2h2-type zn-finger protein n=1 Tax=Culex tarsalis TaxID=7177 RepID=A0A1Q3F3E5_CULTA